MKTILRLFLVAISMVFVSQMAIAENTRHYYGKELCGYDGFTCVAVKRGDTWKKLFPDERQREIVKRLNRTNVSLHHRRWIIVPDNLANISNLDLSPFPDHVKSMGDRFVIVNLGLQAFGAYDKNGRLVHWGPISAGKGWCPDINSHCRTAVGNFKVIEKRGPKCKSGTFPVKTGGGAPMPYCMHFYRGFALHASDLPGYHASHGCVRMFKEDAKWLNQDFTKVGTRVIVTN